MAKLQFDPQSMPIESVAGEAMLPAERLQSDWLRARFRSPPDWQPEAMREHLLRNFTAEPTPAAVLIPLVMREAGLSLLLTRRTAHLTDHAGQISFPGGRTETHDASPIDTALRETEEEVGLQRRHVEVLGALPEYFTGTGYVVSPVVGLVLPPFELQADVNEVAEVFEVPLSFLMNGMHHQRRTIALPNGGGFRTFYAMPYERHFIWGATAGMLRNLYHFMRT